MGLTEKTTILFSPELREHLARVAKQRGASLGELVRSACEAQYGFVSTTDRLAMVDEIGRLSLPVGPPEEMKRESVPEPEDLGP